MSKQVLTALICSLCLFSAGAAAQTGTNFGGMFSASVGKELGRRWSFGLEEELRLRSGSGGPFNRLSTTLDGDYDIIPGKLRIGGLYSFITSRNSDMLIANNHRMAAQFTLRQNVGNIKLHLRGRYQSTFRQEVSKEYKVNPRNYIRTRIGASYTRFGSRSEHGLSAEPFFILDPYGNSLARMRLEYTLQYRLDRRQRLEWSLRVDVPMADKEESLLFQLGIAYKLQWL